MKIAELERIDKDDLVVGRPLPRNAYDKAGKLLLRKGYIIETESQLEALVSRGIYHNHNESPIRVDDLIVESAPAAINLLDNIQSKLALIYRNREEGKMENLLAEILNLCRLINQACDMHIEACISNIFMGSKHRYTIFHPVHVAIVCAIIARKMKWPVNDQLSLLAAVLTANMTKIDLQDKLFYQQGPLTHEQRSIVNEHPERAVEVLRNAGVTNDIWLKGVLYHHEAMDGTGYPYGLKSYAIPLASRIIAAGDIFCAAVTGRAYRSPLSPVAAMRKIFLSADKNIEDKIANMCIKLIGMYPPGTIVRLANDEIAVVTQRGLKTHVPIVHSIIDRGGRKYPRPLKRDCRDSGFEVKEVVLHTDLDIKIDPFEVWHLIEL
jgi:HD-GYP domain-containing protein (c-di-GMP phosphodiesterase class II)